MESLELPLEILIIIVKYVLASARAKDRAALYGLLAANHTTYALVSEKLYRTTILHSSRMTNKFMDALSSSTRLASLTTDLWIANYHFEPFSYQLGSSSDAILRILALTPNLQRLALPSQYFPRFAAPGGLPPIKILMVTEDVFPPSTPDLPDLTTIHVYGPLWPTRVETIISRCPNLRFVICTIPYNSQTYVTPAAQCAETLLKRLPSLVSIEFASSRRVIISLRQFLAGYIGDQKYSSKISTKHIPIEDQDSPCQKWFQESIEA
ncbi:hypothetical protein FRC12_014517 [Ceratobasidium sp. 428]|nr:hypothetical protein FRC12_014517 [Ceratobasidium sp. 428]